MSESQSNFDRMRRGELTPPPVFTLLGGIIRKVDAEAGLLLADYTAAPSFLNPAGGVQGGMLCAMLDDLTAGLVHGELVAEQAVATLGLNVSFLRPAKPGALQGEANFMRRGREICHVSATLSQDGKAVASAVAICKVMR